MGVVVGVVMVVGEWVVNRVVDEEVQVDPVLLLRQLPPLAGQSAID